LITSQSAVKTKLPAKLVLVTRPQQQAAEFIEMLRTRNIESLAFPTIEILPVELNRQLEAVFLSLNNYDLLIFISANAIKQAVKLLQHLTISPASINAKIATIGQATLDVAREYGFKVDITPKDGFNSESLLAMPELQADNIKGGRCLIVRGVGGLGFLAEKLQQRRMTVQYAEIYQRNAPEQDKFTSRKLLSESWKSLGVGAISVTSNESLQNLYDMLEQPGKAEMLTTPLVVVSSRGRELASSLGFSLLSQAKSAMNQHVLEAIVKILK
jgi:uroporphyrinogen-III synthase